MRLVYLDTARSDLAWYRTYYRAVFPEGRKSAGRQYLRAIANLLDNPRIGKPLAKPDTREYSVPRIPFSIIYRLVDDRIEVMRIWDERSDPETRGFHEEAAAYA